MAQAPPCPYCGADSYQLEEERWLTCKGCGHEFGLQHDLCRACGHLNRSEATTCANCDATLREDFVGRVIADRSKDRLAWRQEQLAVAVEQKREEAAALDQGLEAYWADDRARREAAARARAERQEREKRVLIVVGIAAVIIIVILTAVVVILSLSGGAGSRSAILPLVL